MLSLMPIICVFSAIIALAFSWGSSALMTFHVLRRFLTVLLLIFRRFSLRVKSLIRARTWSGELVEACSYGLDIVNAYVHV